MAGMWVMKDIPKPDGSPRTAKEDLVPFRDVYFTSIIRDMKGRKMSKSLGNSPDPLDVIAEYGADALRFTVVYLAPLGQDVLYSNDKCELGRNFANKIWNAGRYLLMNRGQLPTIGALHERNVDLHLDLADRWILSRLHSTIIELNGRLDAFEIQQATKVLYEFIWHDFCDWYVEMTKGRLYGSEPDEVKAILVERSLAIFEQALRLLHPFMPFVTEELWHRIAERDENASIMTSAFPQNDSSRIDPVTEREMAFVQEAILSIRNVRGELGIAPSKEIRVSVDFAEEHKEDVLMNYLTYFQRLARVTSIEKVRRSGKPKVCAGAVVPGGEIFIPLEGLIDLGAERERIAKELSHARGMFESISRKLENESFVAKAPEEVVKKEREKLEHFKSTMEKLEHNLAKL
jgi:valyl-tRNA synthetase